jgi:subtilisin family serine protease
MHLSSGNPQPVEAAGDAEPARSSIAAFRAAATPIPPTPPPPPPPEPDRPAGTPSLPQRLIVKLAYEPGTSLAPGETGADSLDRLTERFEVQRIQPLFDVTQGDVALKRSLGLSRIYVFTLSSDADLELALRAFYADPAVEYAEYDFAGHGSFYPDDPRFAEQWGLHNTGQEGGTPDADVDAPEAWDVTRGVTTTVLAIIDTGVDLDHPDLVGRLVDGYDFVNDDTDPQDDHGHGTHVAGTAAAGTNNGLGVAGVCPECRIMPLKVLNSSNWGYYTWWIEGIEYAVDNGAHVINMSLGGTSNSQALRDAVRYAHDANVPIVAAMMNDGNSNIYYPARFNETIAVGATNRTDQRATFSNYGNHIDLVAPGEAILSTVWDDGYSLKSGTSMAVPHVVGTLGLMHDVYPSAGVEELRDLLWAAAEDQVGPPDEDEPGWDRYFGAGRLNAALAVRYATPLTHLTLDGPDEGYVMAHQTFVATAVPITATDRLSFTWEADDQDPIVHNGGPSSTVIFRWPTSGTYTITVTAANLVNVVSATHVLHIASPPPGAPITVCPQGDCMYNDVQTAVDAASDGSIIQIAAGTYDALNDRGGLPQVLYLDKSVVIQGGFPPDFATPPDPQAHPTILDAGSGGRVLYVTGNVSPTIAGLYLTGGNAAELSGGTGGRDAGGCVYVHQSPVTLRNSWIYSCTATAGGGAYLHTSDATLDGNTIFFNTSGEMGAGLYLHQSAAALTGNDLFSNVAGTQGGGAYLGESGAVLTANTFSANTADQGGGLYLHNSPAALNRTLVVSNTAYEDGGGMELFNSSAVLTNTLVADNQAATGSGLYIFDATPRLLHTTIAHNGHAPGGDGNGLYVANESVVTMTNTILVSHTVGITITADNLMHMEATLWGAGVWANVHDRAGTGTLLTGTLNYRGDPAFVDPQALDYHITLSSTARDAGVSTLVQTDIDGQERPLENGYDLGADEFHPPSVPQISLQADPNPVESGEPLVFTLRVTNTGPLPLTAAVTNTLPAHTLPGGTQVWRPVTIQPGDVWTATVAAIVDAGHTGPLTGTAHVVTTDGVTDTGMAVLFVSNRIVFLDPQQEGVLSDPAIPVSAIFPAGCVTQPTQIGYTGLPTVAVSPPDYAFAGRSFRLEGYRRGALLPTLAFAQPVTLTIRYDPQDVEEGRERSLNLFVWDGEAWSTEGLVLVDRDPFENQVVVTIPGAGRFGLFVLDQQNVFLPTILRDHP